MTKVRKFSLYGVTGEGRTMTDAKAQHAALVTAAVAALERGPSIYLVGSLVVTVFPVDAGSWSYCIVDPASPRVARQANQCRASTFGPDEVELTQSALRHAASNAWSHDCDDNIFIAGLPVAMTADSLAETRRAIGWQRRYKAAAGIIAATAHDDANVIHRIACDTETVEQATIAAQNYMRASEAIATSKA